MNALTICQPYAHLIAEGEKRVENRKWYTRYRGLLAIHAGKSREWLDLDDEGLDDSGYAVNEMAFGAVVAIAELIDCLSIAEIRSGRWDEKYPWIKNHLHTEGPFCFVLGNVLKLKRPIPVSGAQGLWSWDTTGFSIEKLEEEIEGREKADQLRLASAFGFGAGWVSAK